MRNKIRLLKNLIVVFLLASITYFLYVKWSAKEKPEFILSDSPLHLESMERIAEMATVSFKDEVVADTFERFQSETEQLSENLKRLYDVNNVKEALSGSNIKRRLTLILKGEAKIGFKLTENNYRIEQNTDTVWFHFPKAEILSVSINPSETEVFEESGYWTMSVRQDLLNKAKKRIERDVVNAKLTEKAEEGMKNLMGKIILGKRTILVYYE